MKLEISDQAASDLVEIWTYIAEKSVRSADRLIDRLHDQCKLIAHTPRMGRERDELAPGLRSFPMDRYMVFYRIDEDCLQVIRVLSGYRDIDSLF